MIQKYQARIVWIGRRQKNVEIQAKLDALSKIGAPPDYIVADATDRNALQLGYEQIKKKHQNIHGVIHSAITLLDKSLARMDMKRFKAGLSAKVDTSVRIAQVFRREPLDFFLFFSSFASFAKTPGQSNYAAGCTFKDAFALSLAQNQQTQFVPKVKIMNWGYWGSVGVVSDQSYQNRMRQLGIGSIEPEEAMKAVETLLTGSIDQIALMKTI